MSRGDWWLLYATVIGFAAVCGAWLGAVWPNGLGAIITVVLSIAYLFVLRHGLRL